MPDSITAYKLEKDCQLIQTGELHVSCELYLFCSKFFSVIFFQ